MRAMTFPALYFFVQYSILQGPGGFRDVRNPEYEAEIHPN